MDFELLRGLVPRVLVRLLAVGLWIWLGVAIENEPWSKVIFFAGIFVFAHALVRGQPPIEPRCSEFIVVQRTAPRVRDDAVRAMAEHGRMRPIKVTASRIVGRTGGRFNPFGSILNVDVSPVGRVASAVNIESNRRWLSALIDRRGDSNLVPLLRDAIAAGSWSGPTS